MAKPPLQSVLRHVRSMVQPRGNSDRSDRQLLERFVSTREEGAFVALLERHGPMVFRVGLRAVGNAQDAEDVFQATFLLLARKADSIRKRDSVASWLHGVAGHLGQEIRGRGARRQARERRAADMRKARAVSAETWQDLEKTFDLALRQIPEKYRAPLVLCYLEDKTQEEAARQLGCPLGTLRSRLARGRLRLSEVLKRHGVHLSATAFATVAAANSTAAAVPTLLVNATTAAALSYAAGKSAATLVSAQTAALVKAGLKAAATAHVKFLTTIALGLGALSLGAGGFAAHLFARPGQPAAQASRAEGQLAMNAPAPKANKSEPLDQDTNRTKEQETITVRGRVLESDGKAAVGAKLFAPRLARDEPLLPTDFVMELLGATAADGKFTVTTRLLGSLGRSYVIAYAPGFGVDWIQLKAGKLPDQVTLRLPKDVPIEGRVVNLEGKPVPGVSVAAAAIHVPANERLDDYLDGWLRNLRDGMSTPRKRLYSSLEGITGSVRTDAEGRFTLHGAGAERIVHVSLSGGGIAKSKPYVITRLGFDPTPYNNVLAKKEHETLRALNRFRGLSPPSFTFVAEPGKTVTGIVTDAASQEPMPGCRLSVQTGYDDAVFAISDATGKYRIEGIPKDARGYRVFVRPPDGTTYLTRVAQAADSGGYETVRFDIGLAKGAIVSGRVLDPQTGKGPRSGIRFAPLPDNAFFASKPGFDNYRYDGTMADTDAQGYFRMVTIPGRSLITAQVNEGEEMEGMQLPPYRRASPDPEHKELFHYDKDDDTWTVTTAENRLEILDIENAVKVIDISENGENKVELLLNRGAKARVTVQDSQGNPLPGAWVAGLTDHWPITYRLPGATAPVVALDPEKPRQLSIYHPDKQLGGTVTVRGDEREPVIAKLGPLGAVTGRLLEVDGSPLVRATVSINPPNRVASELYRFGSPPGKSAVTAGDGRFTLNGVVPGVAFYVSIQKEGHFYRTAKQKIGLKKLKAGEHIDLGERTVELAR